MRDANVIEARIWIEALIRPSATFTRWEKGSFDAAWSIVSVVRRIASASVTALYSSAFLRSRVALEPALLLLDC